MGYATQVTFPGWSKDEDIWLHKQSDRSATCVFLEMTHKHAHHEGALHTPLDKFNL